MCEEGSRPFRCTARLQVKWFLTKAPCQLADLALDERFRPPRRGAGVVERGGLENRCGRKSTQGSNPCLSAIFQFWPKYRKNLNFSDTCGVRAPSFWEYAKPSKTTRRSTTRFVMRAPKSLFSKALRGLRGSYKRVRTTPRMGIFDHCFVRPDPA